MKLTFSKKILRLSSIYIGIFLVFRYLFEYFIIQYFTSIGLPEKASGFGLSILLIIGGIKLNQNYALGENLILGFVMGNILDRIILAAIYIEYLDIYFILNLSILCSFIIGIIWYFTPKKYSKNYKYLILSVLLILLIVLSAKLLPPTI